MNKKTKLGISITLLIPCIILSCLFMLGILQGGHDIAIINLLRMLNIISFSTFFIVLLFIIEFTSFKRIFSFIMVLSLSFWIAYVILNIMKLKTAATQLSIFYQITKLLFFSILGPSLILYTLHYIKNHSAIIRKYTAIGNYNLHEGFVGLIFALIAIGLIRFRSTLIPHGYSKIETVVIIAIVQIFILLLLFFAGLLIFRDYKDVFHFKFIRKVRNTANKQDGIQAEKNNFNITKNDLPFYQLIRIMIFPIGFILCSLSINMMIYGDDFLLRIYFHLTDEQIISIGFLSCFISGGIIGLDWLRLMQIFYPQTFRQLEEILNTLRVKNE